MAKVLKKDEKDLDIWFVQVLHKKGIKTLGYKSKKGTADKISVIMAVVERHFKNYPNKDELKFFVEKCNDEADFYKKNEQYKLSKWEVIK